MAEWRKDAKLRRRVQQAYECNKRHFGAHSRGRERTARSRRQLGQRVHPAFAALTLQRVLSSNVYQQHGRHYTRYLLSDFIETTTRNYNLY